MSSSVSLTYEPGYKGSIDRALLRYWAEDMRLKKAYLKHVQAVDSEHCRRIRETRRVEAEIRVLRNCIRQVHWLRAVKRGQVPRH